MRYKLLFFFFLISITVTSHAYTTDTGKVTRIYSAPSGAIAFQMLGGFNNANESGQCESNNGWAGVVEADPFLKALILAAKMAGQNVTVALEGCQGNWFKIKDIYLNED